MAYVVPSFPLSVTVYDSRVSGPFPGVIRLTTMGNFVFRGPWQNTLLFCTFGVQGTSGLILLPAGTDVRDFRYSDPPDRIEVVSGSGCFYWVLQVEDRAKGFPNEHRVALLQQYTASFPLR